MTCVAIFIGWAMCSSCAFWLLQDDWRRDLDLDFGTVIFIAFIASAGPIGAVAAIVCWLAGRGSNKILLKRK